MTEVIAISDCGFIGFSPRDTQRATRNAIPEANDQPRTSSIEHPELSIEYPFPYRFAMK